MGAAQGGVWDRRLEQCRCHTPISLSKSLQNWPSVPCHMRRPHFGNQEYLFTPTRNDATVEEDALREGISLGMTLIDTAEISGNGEAEKLIGRRRVVPDPDAQSPDRATVPS